MIVIIKKGSKYSLLAFEHIMWSCYMLKILSVDRNHYLQPSGLPFPKPQPPSKSNIIMMSVVQSKLIPIPQVFKSTKIKIKSQVSNWLQPPPCPPNNPIVYLLFNFQKDYATICNLTPTPKANFCLCQKHICILLSFVSQAFYLLLIFILFFWRKKCA